MIYDVANSILHDVSSFSNEARAYLEEERYRAHIPTENINPSNVVIDLIPIIIDELLDYGIVVRTDPVEIAESGSTITGFFKCARYLLPNGIQPLIRNDRTLLSIYEEIAGQYSTSRSSIITDLLMAIGGSDAPYIPTMRDACIDVLERVDMIGSAQYTDTILTMCDIVRKERASDMSDHLDYVKTVYSFYSSLTEYFNEHRPRMMGWGEFREHLDMLIKQLMSILTSRDVMDSYSSIMFGSQPNQLNLDVPVLALSPLVPSYWRYRNQPIGGSDPFLEQACNMLRVFTSRS